MEQRVVQELSPYRTFSRAQWASLRKDTPMTLTVGESRERLIEEAADVIYHLLVVLKARDIKLTEVEAVLGARASQSGLAEKASRKGG